MIDPYLTLFSIFQKLNDLDVRLDIVHHNFVIVASMHSMVYKGHAIRDDIKILRDGMGCFISIFKVEWDSSIIRVII